MKALWRWFTRKSKKAKLGLLIVISAFSRIIFGGTFPLGDEYRTESEDMVLMAFYEEDTLEKVNLEWNVARQRAQHRRSELATPRTAVALSTR